MARSTSSSQPGCPGVKMAWLSRRRESNCSLMRARGRGHGIGQEPVRRDVGGRAADERDLGVAVEVDFLDVIVELEILDGLRPVAEFGIPSGFAYGFAHAHERLDLRVFAQEVRVAIEDELPGQLGRALRRKLGRGRLGAAHVEQRAVNVIHCHESCRHASRGAQEFAPGHPLPRRELVGQHLEPRFHPALGGGLRNRHILVAGDDLGRDRPIERSEFCRQQRLALLIGQQIHWAAPSKNSAGRGPAHDTGGYNPLLFPPNLHGRESNQRKVAHPLAGRSILCDIGVPR